MLKRARLLFVVALAVAITILATEFPIGQLVHDRSAASAAAAELARVRHENKVLAGDVSGLKSGSVIQQIAHQDYGLVEPGQRSYVIMPSSSSTAPDKASGPLARQQIPRSDIVPSDSLLSPPAAPKSPEAGQSFWRRLLNRLEFWKAVA